MNQQQQPSILTCQIIAFGLIMGVVMFAGLTLTMQPEQPPQDLPVMFLIAATGTVLALAIRFFILRILDEKAEKKLAVPEAKELSSQEWLELYQSRVLLSLAMIEGPAFLCLVMFMVEGRRESFGLAILLLVFMAMNFPTENKFKNWVRKVTGQSAYAGDE